MNWASFIGACALAAAAGSLASDRIFAEGAGGVMSDRVQIELRGSITPRCAFQNIASSLDLGVIPDSDASGEKRLDFQISCNAPFAYGLSSEGGAMGRDDGAEGAGGFLTQFPYRAALTILMDDGTSLTTTCQSQELGALPGLCQWQSGERTAIDRAASLTVSWGPIEGRLAAGRYSGSLQISLGIAN